MYSFLRQAIDLIWHKGPIHQPKEDGDYWNFRDAVANNIDSVRDDVKNTAYIRDPENTPIFDDLEKEYGLLENRDYSADTRVSLLKAARYRKKTTASDDNIQDLLDKAGFDLTVYNNSPNGPPVNPATILTGSRYLLPNGSLYTQAPAIWTCGDTWCGNFEAVCGYFDYLFKYYLDYPMPTDPLDWPFVFFIGGDATFNATTGQILTIADADVPQNQQIKLERLVLQAKPIFTWAGMIINYT